MDIPYRYIPNHVSNETEVTLEPWEHCVAPKSKRKWTKWAKNPETEHCFISLNEARPYNLRVSKENPVQIMRGLILDYDCLEDSRVKPPSEWGAFPPTFLHRTVSGGWRLIWEFERPIAVGSSEFYRKLVELLLVKLKANKLLPGLDRPAAIDPKTYYDVGRDWEIVSENPSIRDKHLKAWEREAWKRCQQDLRDLGNVEVPIEAVRTRLSSIYPDVDFAWSDFEVGFRPGYRFWEPDADSDSVIVMPGGIKPFSGPDAWLSWSDPRLCGSEFVAEFSEDAVTTAIENFWMVGTKYYERSGGLWLETNSEHVRIALSVSHGISRQVPRGENFSPLEEALREIKVSHSASMAAAFNYRAQAVVPWQGQKVLNIATAKVCPPTKHSAEWGENFPRLARFLEQLFEENLEHVIAWLHDAWCSGYYYRPHPGLILIVVGPPGNGKGFFQGAIVGQLLGFSANAQEYLMGDDKFNRTLLQAPHWRLDDPVSSSATGNRWASRQLLAKILKQLAANDHIVCRGMHAEGITIPNVARVVLTLNLDKNDLEAFPQLNDSMLDKVLVTLTHPTTMLHPAPTDEEILNGELPHFAAFLRDYEIPQEIKDPRFGVAGHFDPKVKTEVEAESPEGDRIEIIAQCIKMSGGRIEDLSVSIYSQFTEDFPSFREAFNSAIHFGRTLSTYVGRQDMPFTVFKRRSGSGTIWVLAMR